MNAIRTTATVTATLSSTDEAFFRITASLFAPSFLLGAGVLLATYDDEDEPPPAMIRTRVGTGTGCAQAPTSVSV